MSFLQPLLLYGLPLIALPIVIHLINRQRHRTVPWAAMLFLIDARRMTSGMAKLRQFLILLMRMLIIAGLVFALSRPLAGLWLNGVAGGATDTTIVLLDRSASMEQQNLQSGKSKRTTGLDKLADMLEKIGKTTRIVLIESVGLQPIEVDQPNALGKIPNTNATSTTANIPALLEKALDFIETNKTGRTDIWLCSDLRESDWDSANGRWEAVRTRATRQKGLRFFLLAYPDAPPEDFIIRVTKVRRHKSGTKSELLLDASLRREGIPIEQAVEVPLEIVVNGTRTTHTVKMDGSEFKLQGHAFPIDVSQPSGWGRIGLPGDSNPRNNTAHFVFAEPPVQKTVVVSDDPDFARLVGIAARAPMDRSLKYEVDSFSINEANKIDWHSTAALVWQGAPPTGIDAQQVMNFVDAGKSAIFFPPETPSDEELFGCKWTEWDNAPETIEPVGTWRTDSGLLRNTQDGKALPVGKLQIYQHCGLHGSGSVLARMESGKALLTHVPTDRGGVWFWGTLPKATHSSLARDGVVFYIMLQRAITAGTKVLGQALQAASGQEALDPELKWTKLDAVGSPTASTLSINSGVFESPDGKRQIALNRPESEDRFRTLDNEALETLLEGIEFQRIDDRAGSLKSLASEIWRMFLILASLALILEALLCLPEKKQTQPILGIS